MQDCFTSDEGDAVTITEVDRADPPQWLGEHRVRGSHESRRK